MLVGNTYRSQLSTRIIIVSYRSDEQNTYLLGLIAERVTEILNVQEHLCTVLENMPVMMIAFDVEGNIIVWNKECEQITGYTAAEIVKHPQAKELFYGETEQASRGNDFRDCEWEIACKDGCLKTVVWSNISNHFSIPSWAGWGICFDNSLPKFLKGDPGRLRQVLFNLLGNAIKFAAAGTVTIKTILQLETEQTALIHFAIIDTGIGISGVNKEYLTLNTRQQSLITQPRLTPKTQQPANLKILVAEDNSINQAVILSQLEMLGYQEKCVSNGLEALELLTRQDYDLILMDCQMPVMDGYTATQELRLREDNTRHSVVIATANAMLEDRQKCLAAGMDDYLSKPLEQEDLAKVIQRWTTQKAKNEASNNQAEQDMILNSNPSPNSPEFVRIAELTAMPREESKKAIALQDSPPIDLERLARISRGKIAVQQQLLKIFIDKIPKDLVALETAISAIDTSQVQYYAHRLKGSAANVGVPAMSALAEELEQIAQQESMAGASELLDSLWHVLERVQAYVKSEIMTHK